jgi:hypothetical protein
MQPLNSAHADVHVDADLKMQMSSYAVICADLIALLLSPNQFSLPSSPPPHPSPLQGMRSSKLAGWFFKPDSSKG